MGQPVEQCGRHLGIAEHARPFTEAEIGGDDNAGALMELAQEMEEQRAAGCTERQVAQLVQNDEIGMNEAIGDLPGSALCLLLIEGIDQFDGREEPNTFAVVLDGLHADGGRQMGFSCAGAADQNDVVGFVDELAAMELAHERLVDLAA